MNSFVYNFTQILKQNFTSVSSIALNYTPLSTKYFGAYIRN
jgi:hypothetical protein